MKIQTKTLKFATDLIPLVLSGAKYSTWRLWDDKDIRSGDVLDLLSGATRERFVTARVIKVVEKPLGDLTAEDKEGHEDFEDEQQMYQTYTKYYNRPVGPQTKVKIVTFELLDN